MKKFKWGIIVMTAVMPLLLLSVNAMAQECWKGKPAGGLLYDIYAYYNDTYVPGEVRYVGIGTHNPQAPLHVVGNTRILGTARIPEICDENGEHCKDFSEGWFSLSTPGGGQPNVVYVNNDANVGVGTTNPQSKLTVNGTITAKEVKVTLAGWSDYVFGENYCLLSLDELETYVNREKHLPDIPSAKEVEEEGLEVAAMLSKQMQKIEELTLYLIQLKKENEELKERITALEEGR